MLVLEKDVHENSIQQARMKYSERINANKEQMLEIDQALASLDLQTSKNKLAKAQLDTDRQELVGAIEQYS